VKPLREKKLASVEEWVDYDDLPKKLQRAIITNNDPDFFKRHAVSFASLTAADRSLCVPSPLTRHVAHVLFPTPSWNPLAPLRDFVVAASIEKNVPRQRILDLYVNAAAQFGEVTGVGAAAKQYLRKPADDLSDREAEELVAKLR